MASYTRGTFTRLTIVAGVVLTAVVLVSTLAVLFLRPRPSADSYDPSTAHTAWQEEVRRIAAEVEAHPSTDRLRDLREKLLTFRVTAEDRDVHLRFILALLALERGDTDAERSFAEARDAALQTN